MSDIPDLEVVAPQTMFSLAEKVVIITGASSGLGARWAPVVAAAGAQVVMTARREVELGQVAAAVPGAVAIVGDVTDAEHREHLVASTVDSFGRIDVLINNAGSAISAPATEMSVEQFREMIDSDLTSLFALSQLVARAMIEAGRGSIINITSLGAERALDRYPLAAYSAAKAGAAALTRNLASEWGRYGVRVNAVGPAFFPTRLSGYTTDPDMIEWIEHHTALRRTARIDELDGTIVFLASDASSFITGQQLFVDGGWSVY